MALPEHLVLIRSTYAPFGGVERVALSLVNGLLAKGIHITLLTLPQQRWPLAHPNLNIVRLGLNKGHRLIQAWTFNRSVIRYLSRYKSDVVLSLDKVTHYTHLHAGGGTHKTFLSIKSKYSSRFARIFLKLSLFHRYIQHVEKKGFENANLVKIRCNSRMVMELIQKDYGVPPEKMVLVPSGIRWKEMEEVFLTRESVGRELCQRHNLDPHWKKLLILGSGFPNKGLDIAIKGLSAMPQDFHLVVVGKGDPRPYKRMAMRMGLGERIHFLGPQPKGWRYAALCEAMVLPSQYDPFGGASAEGHAMGVPVLVSDRTGYCDWVIHGRNGVILRTPMTEQRIHEAFNLLNTLIEQPVMTPGQLRQHARNMDDDVVLDQLLTEFLKIDSFKHGK
jgi:UDP-glucose:(heptosyl)LPS alpha-1,3-glucosyltransferase